MKQNVDGPYQVTDEDLEYHETLDAIDVGKWYIIINGSMQFVADRKHGITIKEILTKIR